MENNANANVWTDDNNKKIPGNCHHNMKYRNWLTHTFSAIANCQFNQNCQNITHHNIYARYTYTVPTQSSFGWCSHYRIGIQRHVFEYGMSYLRPNECHRIQFWHIFCPRLEFPTVEKWQFTSGGKGRNGRSHPSMGNATGWSIFTRISGCT